MEPYANIPVLMRVCRACPLPCPNVANSDPPKAFLKLMFENKGLDAIRLSNILNHKSVCSKIPPYFKNTKPCVYYSYTRLIASKLFNYKATLRMGGGSKI